MEHCSLKQAKRVAKKLCKAVAEIRFLWEKKHFNIGVSIGLVVIDETTGDVTDILKNADAACYAAKEQGRNRIHLYHADDEQLSKQQGEMQWVSKINHALKEDRFSIVYQKILPLTKGSEFNKNKFYELLIRMNLNGEIVTPDKFLSAAERYGMVPKIDRWMIQSSFDFFVEHQDILDSISKIFINLSGHSLSDNEFLQYIIDSFNKSGMPADKICFEITETAAIANLAKANIFIEKLKIVGCAFALDDFGSGLSSFAYLRTLAVDFLKIDGFFVKNINDDPIAYAMVKSINEIGHEMGIQTIAEFVETKQILEKLKDLKIDYAQGYYLGKPEPLFEITGY
jgi:EAL domain-containing protein (putative c-di-GMP-specific phosphodiesterase class I)